MPVNLHSDTQEHTGKSDASAKTRRNTYALYQLKPDPQYHELRYSSLSELQSAADHMFSDVQHIVQASEGLLFPSKAAVETYLESKGLSTVACADPTSIHVENEAFQSATIHLACGDGGCWIESCEQVPSIQTVTEKRYHLVYTGDLPDDCVSLEEPDALLEDLFFRFNSCHPKDFHGRSMSVSDVVALTVNGQTSCYYTNSISFIKLPSFLSPENSLRNAEMLMEDDYNMIDGILNNGLKPAEHETSTPGRSKKTDDERRLKHRKHRDTPER